MLLCVLTLASALQAPPSPPPPVAPAPAAAADVRPHLEAGLAAFKRRRLAQAQTHFQQAVDADPASAAAHFYLGYAIYKRAEPRRPFHPDKQRAAGLFARAYELEPAFRPVWGPRK
jgi:tetratricopeptide (TPR) repeat protein